ncbi:MAG: ADP-ribosylglycohydrolase family protein [Eubacterium sp.]|nr:ADP-ribosylglycohydrolase family protein [Eubacterium sp.]
MYGAILGDMIGSPYEFDQNNIKTKEFPLFRPESQFTDDSVMTVAVADALMKIRERGLEEAADRSENSDEDQEIRFIITQSLKKWGNRYPDAGYGVRFIKWLRIGNGPYGSYGNGSAMRVSPAGWLYDTMEKTREMARYTSVVTHDHPEGIKGAEAVAAVVFLARTGASKDDIKAYIEGEFGYDLSRTCDEIRPSYHHVESCQKTVPEAVTAFLEGQDFVDVIRTAVSLGGDCDTLTCIAGSMAEAFYGVPEDLTEECRARLTPDMLNVVDRFYAADINGTVF